MPKGHYTLVESLIEIYCSDPLNEVFVYTNSQGNNIIEPMIKGSNKNVTIVCKRNDEKIKSFFHRINNQKFEKLYIVTLEKYFLNFISLKNNSPLFLFVHNIEDWFKLSPNILLYRFFHHLFIFRQFVYNFKVCFIHPILKNNIKKIIYNSGGKFVVLNNILKKELSMFLNEDRIEVIPFSVYIPSLLNHIIDNNRKINICIPGILDNFRRDYLNVFRCIENNLEDLKDKFVLELLGGINSGSYKIINEANQLVKKGFNVVYYKSSYIPMQEYNVQINKSDIILGNLNVVLNKYSIYGKTKDTGAIFIMIKYGKPGILPGNYALIDELKTSTLTYNTYDELALILKKLILEPELLEHITEQAIKNSQNFEPAKILNSL